MNKHILKIAAVLAVLCTSSYMQAYRWNMRNDTNQMLLMDAVLYTGVSYPEYYNFVRPGEYADFSWPVGNAMAGYRLEKIKYLKVDDALYRKMMLAGIIDNTGRLASNDKVAKWLKDQNLSLTTLSKTAWKWGAAGTAMAKELSSWNNLSIKEENGNIVVTGNS